jgi:putative nucleotidyltransferase with HDIG domain
MTPNFAAVCLALLLQGMPAALLCASLGALVGIFVGPAAGSWRLKLLRPPWYRVVFNLANCTIACVVGSVAFEQIVHWIPRGRVAVVLGLLAFTTCHFLVNTLGVSLAIGFQQRLHWFAVWRENFLWTAPGYFASASAAVTVQAFSRQLGFWSLLFLPPVYLIYYSYRLDMERIHLYNDKVTQDMAHIQELNQLNQAIIASLATAIDAKDRHTSSHINRVQHYAVHLARAAGLTDGQFEAVVTAALVHDIGKLGKPGKLAPEEFRRMQSHVAIGTEILSPIPFPFPVVEIVETHHERWDG